MKREVKRLIVKMLKEYPDLPKRIQRREWEIKHPITKPDENVGGGRAQNKRWDYYDNIVITLDEDMELNNLQREYEAISACLDKAGQDTVAIIQGLYMSRYPSTVTELVTTGKLFCSKTTAYKLRDRFIEQVASKMRIKYL